MSDDRKKKIQDLKRNKVGIILVHKMHMLLFQRVQCHGELIIKVQEL